MTTEQGSVTAPAAGCFVGDRLELVWQYAYRREFIPLLLDYLGARDGMRVLDAGCGTAFLARLLATHLAGVQIAGLDADTDMLQRGQELLQRAGFTDRIRLFQGDGYDIPFPDDSFDLVTSQTFL